LNNAFNCTQWHTPSLLHCLLPCKLSRDYKVYLRITVKYTFWSIKLYTPSLLGSILQSTLSSWKVHSITLEYILLCMMLLQAWSRSLISGRSLALRGISLRHFAQDGVMQVHEVNEVWSLGASRSVWEDVECKLTYVNFRRVLDHRREFQLSFEVTGISDDWYRSIMGVCAMRCRTPQRPRENIRCTWEHLGMQATSVWAPTTIQRGPVKCLRAPWITAEHSGWTPSPLSHCKCAWNS
jgi:hypothetical protein